MNRKQLRKLTKKRKSRQIRNRESRPEQRAAGELLHEKLGPPGVNSELYIAFVRKDGSVSAKDQFVDKTKRKFEVTLYFKKDYIYSSEIKVQKPLDSGSSFLIFPKNAEAMAIEASGISFNFYSNSMGEASSVKASIESLSRSDAISKFMDNLTPALDHLSYISNSPIHYEEIHVVDTLHKAQSVNYMSPYRNFSVNGMGLILKPMFPIYSLYREAKNTVSPFYKIFCYCKIMEGIISKIRPAVFKEIRALNLEIKIEKDIVPAHEELELFNRQYINKPIVQLYEGEFQKTYRDAMAHFALDDKDPVNLSGYSERGQFSSKVFLFETCCRILIENTEYALNELENQKVSRK